MMNDFKELVKVMDELPTIHELRADNDLYDPAGRAYATAVDILRGTDRRYTLIEQNNDTPFKQLLRALKKVPVRMDISNTEITKEK